MATTRATDTLLRSVILLLVALTGAVVLRAPALAAEPSVGAPIDISGTFHVGEPGQVAWRVQKPAAWNGTLLLDLDFAPSGYSAAQTAWFMQKGYAIGGIQRTQNETAYELKKYVDDLVVVREKLIEAASGTPERTIAVGNSRGGFVSRMAVQYRPDIFKGALSSAGGGAGVVGSWLGKADAVWVLKILVDPQSTLTVNNLPDIPPGGTYGPSYEQDQALGQLVTLARSTPQGMARLVLAAAYSQSTEWGSGPVRPAPTDYETQGNIIAQNFAFGHPQFVHKEIEVMSGGAVTWNHGVNYTRMLEKSGALERVRWWYERAGLDLDADLRTLRRAPRFSASPAAMHRVEQIGTYNGDTGGAPVMDFKTIGDPADTYATNQAYLRTFEAAGNSGNVRLAYVERAGHGTTTLRERLAAFETLIARMDTGIWPATDPESLNARAATVGADTTLTDAQLGAAQFIDYPAEQLLRGWDFTNWGEYFASYVRSLNLRGEVLLVSPLDAFAIDLQKGRKARACLHLVEFGLWTALTQGSLVDRANAKQLLTKARDLADELGCAR